MDYLYLAPARVQAFNDLANEVDKTVRRFGQWIMYEDGIECSPTSGEDYCIERDRVRERMWVPHMMSKPWVILTEFCDALYFAREHYGFDGFNRTELHTLQHPCWISGRRDRNEVLLDPSDLEELSKWDHG